MKDNFKHATSQTEGGTYIFLPRDSPHEVIGHDRFTRFGQDENVILYPFRVINNLQSGFSNTDIDSDIYLPDCSLQACKLPISKSYKTYSGEVLTIRSSDNLSAFVPDNQKEAKLMFEHQIPLNEEMTRDFLQPKTWHATSEETLYIYPLCHPNKHGYALCLTVLREDSGVYSFAIALHNIVNTGSVTYTRLDLEISEIMKDYYIMGYRVPLPKKLSSAYYDHLVSSAHEIKSSVLENIPRKDRRRRNVRG